DNQILHRLFGGVSRRLNKEGRFWLIYSDFAWRMGLLDDFDLDEGKEQPRWVGDWVDALCSRNGLRVVSRDEIPSMVQVTPGDPFHDVRATEMVSLYEIALQ